MIEFVTERLIIRPIVAADVDSFELGLGDAEVMEYSDDGPLSRADVSSWVAKQIEDYSKCPKFGRWVIAIPGGKATTVEFDDPSGDRLEKGAIMGDEQQAALEALQKGFQPVDAVDIQMVGACGGCPLSMMTLKAGIERILMDRVPGVKEVRASSDAPGTLEEATSSSGITLPTL